MTFTKKLEILNNDLCETIAIVVNKKGKDSKVGYKTIKIKGSPDKYYLGSSYLVEVGTDYLFDYYGYQYDFSVLSMGELCELVDYIKQLK